MDIYEQENILSYLNNKLKFTCLISYESLENLRDNTSHIKLPQITTDEELLLFRKILKLECSNCQNITDEGIKNLTQLTTLNCDGCHNITFECIKLIRSHK